MPGFAAGVAYTYTRTTRVYGNGTGNFTRRAGMTLDDYTPGSGYTGVIPLEGGVAYDVPTFIPDMDAISAGGNGFVMMTIPGYYMDYHGLELTLNKRLSNRWMGRVGLALNNARDHFTSPDGRYDVIGNPTRTVTEPLDDGGQVAPEASGSGSGTVYLNARWQLNASGMYQAPYGIDLSANVFGRQGYPFPVVRQGTPPAMGADSGLPILLSPKIDTFRYPDLWNTDVRVAREFRSGGASFRVMFDVFNLMNANTALLRVNDVTATNFNALVQNLSPRIARVGVIVGF
jgi:hypothetical protein